MAAIPEPPWLAAHRAAQAQAQAQAAASGEPAATVDDRGVVRLPGGKFAPGQSGNPAGRAPGTVNKQTELRRMMADGGESIVRMVVAKAQAGDLEAAGMVLQRIAPPLRPHGRQVNFKFDLAAPLAEQAQQVVNACAAGELSVEEAQMLVNCLSNAAGLKQVDELAARIAALEGKAAVNGGRTFGAGLVLMHPAAQPVTDIPEARE